MKRSFLLFVSWIPLLLTTTWATTAAALVTDSGTVITDVRSLAEFHTVNVIGSFQISYEPGLPGAEITADEAIVPIIKTQVNAGVLSIFASESFRTATPIQILIKSSALGSYKAQGSGTALLQLPAGTQFALTQNGSGRIEVQSADVKDRLVLTFNGSGEVDASGVVAKSVEVTSLGSGRAIVNATERLKARLQGSGSIRYLGNPPIVIRTILGSGSILPY